MSGIKRSVSLAPTARGNGDPKVRARKVKKAGGAGTRNGAPHHKQLRNR